MLQSSLQLTARVLVVATLGACVELPLERSNPLDPGSGTRIVFEGLPDTINAVGEVFDLTTRLDPEPGNASRLPTIELEYPDRLIRLVGLTQYRSTSEVGYLPVRAVFRARFTGVTNGPWGEREVIVRQRPTSLALLCLSPDGCATMPAGGALRQLTFQSFDPGGTPVTFPSGSFRFGTVISRDPSRVQILGRPAANVIDVKSVGVGRTWIVMTADGNLRDSLAIEVLP